MSSISPEAGSGLEPPVGAARIISLFRKYSIKSTWFIPGHTIETFPEESQLVFRDGHEIGHHNYLHEVPNVLSLDEERRVIKKGIECIEKLTGKRPAGYRSPS